MKIEILKLEKTYAKLLLRDTSTATVNALRRTLVKERDERRTEMVPDSLEALATG